jgi:hypothetical protein
MMARSNVGSATSLGDLIDLLGGVPFGSTSATNSNTSSDRVPRHSKSKNIDNKCKDNEGIADSGIRKVNSYPDLCTNKAYIVGDMPKRK